MRVPGNRRSPVTLLLKRITGQLCSNIIKSFNNNNLRNHYNLSNVLFLLAAVVKKDTCAGLTCVITTPCTRRLCSTRSHTVRDLLQQRAQKIRPRHRPGADPRRLKIQPLVTLLSSLTAANLPWVAPFLGLQVPCLGLSYQS